MIICPACGSENPAGFRFCGACGARLEGATAPEPASSELNRTAERRPLTVVFCDLVDSTALSLKLDPEELRDVIHAYQDATVRAVARYGGHVAQYLGDGVLVYFGYPEAHEDDARRAVRAGLGVLDAVRALGSRLPVHGVVIEARVGVHTGPVVAGEVGSGTHKESLAIGATPNIAARVQSLAAPGTIAISAATHRLVRDAFTFESLGSHAAKGLTKPVEIFRVLEILDKTHGAVATTEASTPAVGRQDDVRRCLAALEDARRGDGRFIQVSGGPGVGKSRVIRMFQQAAGDSVSNWMVAACSPYEESAPFSAIIELLRRMVGLGSDLSQADAIALIENAIRGTGLDLNEAVPYFADLLSIPLADPYRPVELMFNKRQERTIQLLVAFFVAYARQAPSVLVIEDAHWADPSTRQFLQALVPAVANTPLAVVVSFRPGFTIPWEADARVVDITLDRLSDDEAHELLNGLLAGMHCPPAQITQIVAKADGVPLYLEELTTMLIETGQLQSHDPATPLGAPLKPLDIPDTLQASLMARLDRLGAAKELAQLGAVLGREFSRDMLGAVWSRKDAALPSLLKTLVDSGLLFERMTDDTLAYSFKHALIRDAAYESLLKTTRQQHHRRVAEVMKTTFPAVAERSPELLARHYEGAGMSVDAIAAWCAASRRAFWRSSFLEAIQHCRNGLALLESVPPDDRDRNEIDLLVTLGPALTATTGYAGPEVGPTYSRALELCKNMPDSPHMFWIQWGVGSYYFNRADFAKAHDCMEQMFMIARQQHDPALVHDAYFSTGVIATLRGRITEAVDALEQGVALITPERDPRFAALTGIDCAVATLSFAAIARQLSGNGTRALELMAQCRDEARRLERPMNIAWALAHSAILHTMRNEPAEVLQFASEGLPLCEKTGIVIFMPLIGHCAGAAANDQAGLEQMMGGLGFWRAIGSDVWQTFLTGNIATWHVLHDDANTARTLVEEAIAAAERTDERVWYPALLCMRGDLSGDRIAAAEAYRAALAAARAQGALMFEARAVGALEESSGVA